LDLATIQRRIELIEKYEAEIKTAKEMIKNDLENDPEYIKASEEAKEVLSKKRNSKEIIYAKAEIQKLLRDVKDNVEEIATLKDILSQELMQLYEESRADEIEDSGGEVRKFKIFAKLLPKRKAIYDKYDDMVKDIKEVTEDKGE
jgi:hypothetical protein